MKVHNCVYPGRDESGLKIPFLGFVFSVKFVQSKGDIAFVIMYYRFNLGHEWPKSKTAVLKLVREYLHSYGSMQVEIDDVKDSNLCWKRAEDLVDEFFPELSR